MADLVSSGGNAGHGLVMRRIVLAVPTLAVLLSACSTGPATGPATGPPPAARAPASHLPQGDPTLLATTGGGPGRFPPTGHGVLDGRVVLVDPGHNGGNFSASSVINRLIWNGREDETCDTTGAQTDGGYTEARFNWHVALDLTADLR
jgi:N-acetylmuramoyl-L-alanine amidase